MAEFNEDKEAVPRLMRFSGKQADWRVWSRKFLARATLKKYAGVLTGTLKLPDVPTPGKIETTTEIKERQDLQDAFISANSLGYAELISSMFDDVSFSIVDESRTDELPEGDVFLAWSGLKEVFEPSTAASKILLKKQFYESKLHDSTRDPDEWITELALLRQQLKLLKVIIEDDDFVIQIINNLPKEYDSLVELMEDDMSKGSMEHTSMK
jgi:gag-polypeptide of LTR copia-type